MKEGKYHKRDFNGQDTALTLFATIFFGFCYFGDKSPLFLFMMVAFATMFAWAFFLYPLQNILSASPAQQFKEPVETIKSAEISEPGKESETTEPSSLPTLDRDCIGKTILIGFNDIDIAEASLEFLRKKGVKLHEPYEQLYAALEDPHWGKKTAERIIDFMNTIAPEGSELQEINKHAWGFV